MASAVFETHLLEIERKAEWVSDKHGTFGTLFISVILNILYDRKKNDVPFSLIIWFASIA